MGGETKQTNEVDRSLPAAAGSDEEGLEQPTGTKRKLTKAQQDRRNTRTRQQAWNRRFATSATGRSFTWRPLKRFRVSFKRLLLNLDHQFQMACGFGLVFLPSRRTLGHFQSGESGRIY